MPSLPSRLSPRASLACALALVLPGCVLGGGPDDLFPVCEDRRASGPSPTYTLDRLVALTEVRDATLPEAEERALLSAVRERVLTLQGAPYRSFHANLTPAEEEGAWWFEARGVGGPSEGWDDAYRLKLLPRGDGFEAHETRRHVRPAAAPQTLERLAAAEAARTEDLADVRERTPTLVASGVDPELPGCVFLLYEGGAVEEGAPARTKVVVNLVTVRVVHVARDGW